MALVNEREMRTEWVAPDGRDALEMSSLDKGDLLDNDVALFGKEPDEREFEDYEDYDEEEDYGPTLTLTYHATAAVFWLAANTARVGTLADVPAAAARFAETADDAALFDAIMRCAKRGSGKVDASALATVLQALRHSPAAMEPEVAGLRILRYLKQSYGLISRLEDSISVPGDVAAFAAHFASEAVADTLGALVTARRKAETYACCKLVEALAASPLTQAAAVAPLHALFTNHALLQELPPAAVAPLVRTLLPSAETIAANPDAASERAVSMIAALAATHGLADAALANELAEYAARCECERARAELVKLVEARARRGQVPACITLISALGASLLRDACLRALCGSFAAGCLPSTRDATLLRVVQLAFSADGMRSGSGGAFADALLAANARALPALLALPVVCAAATAGDPAAVLLVAERTRELELAVSEGPPPPPSWAQPGASFPSNPAIEAFLRGPEQRMDVPGFASIAKARNYANEHFAKNAFVDPGRRYRKYRASNFRPVTRSYEATAEAHGTSRNAYVTIVKENSTHQKQVKQHAAAVAELGRLRSLRGAAAAA
jgi:hypothetical protein